MVLNPRPCGWPVRSSFAPTMCSAACVADSWLGADAADDCATTKSGSAAAGNTAAAVCRNARRCISWPLDTAGESWGHDSDARQDSQADLGAGGPLLYTKTLRKTPVLSTQECSIL